MAESLRWKSALNVARDECRRNRSKRVDRHGIARYSKALILVSGEERAGSQPPAK